MPRNGKTTYRKHYQANRTPLCQCGDRRSNDASSFQRAYHASDTGLSFVQSFSAEKRYMPTKVRSPQGFAGSLCASTSGGIPFRLANERCFYRGDTLRRYGIRPVCGGNKNHEASFFSPQIIKLRAPAHYLDAPVFIQTIHIFMGKKKQLDNSGFSAKL